MCVTPFQCVLIPLHTNVVLALVRRARHIDVTIALRYGTLESISFSFFIQCRNESLFTSSNLIIIELLNRCVSSIYNLFNTFDV